MRHLVLVPLRFYKRFLSPLLPPMCRFDPTCSVFMMQAVEKHERCGESGSACGGSPAATRSILEVGTPSLEMEKRIFAAVLISIAFLWLWAAVAPKLFPDLMKKPAVAKDVTSPAIATSPQLVTPPSQATVTPGTATPTTTSTAAAVASVPASVAAVAPIAATAQTITVIERSDFLARLSNRGGQLVSFQLLHYKAHPSTKSDQTPVELVKDRDRSRTDYPFAIEATDAAFARLANSSLYTVREFDDRNNHVVEYRWSDGVHTVVKTFRFTGEYLFNFAVSVTPPLPYRVAIGPGIRTLGADEKDNQFIITGNGVVQRDDSLKIIRREKADALSIFPSVQYVGMEDNYFLSVLRPEKSGGAILRAIDVAAGAQRGDVDDRDGADGTTSSHRWPPSDCSPVPRT